jgi:ubiquinone biosynthesis UbiH/UbiF/VisC/COQ6 family hydroxylase
MMKQADYDVIVVGGGLVGAACALAICSEDSGLKVALIESAAQQPLPRDDSWDGRIYAISPGNAAFFARLGVWNAMEQGRITPIEMMRIWGDDGVSQLEFSAYEVGVPALGYIVESRLMQAGLWARLLQMPNIKLINPARCASLTWQDEQALLELSDGGGLSARLIVGADGGKSWTREQAGLGVRTTDYRQMGVVANFATEKPHQHIARQWFREDGILAWLPLPGNRISIVWSTDTEHARWLLSLSSEDLELKVGEAGGGVLGALQMLTPAAAFPLRLQNAEVMVRPRLALVGDAAHLVHPLAGQGVNLGFHDAECLARVLLDRSSQTDAGDYTLLRRYERARKADIMAMQMMTDGLHTLFGSTFPGVGVLRNWGMGFTNRQSWLKKRLMAHAMT